ncbi:MAG: MCE family protein [Haloechinothrix sp.]
MLTKVVRIRVIVFVVISLLGVSYAGARYAGLGALVGGSGYVVRVQLADSGGIFTHAEVTYRGVAIGRVGELRLIDGGVQADLRIRDDAPRVPADVKAVVANRSAAGEQYLDLRPQRDGGPFLGDGSVVAQEDTSTPLRVETVLLNLDRLVSSVPKEDLKTVVDELYDATEGTASSLRALLDSSASFTEQATKHLPQTERLISDASTVLSTQIEVSDAIKSFGVNAKLVAEQLERSDGDFRRLLTTGPDAAQQVRQLIAETGTSLGVIVANLLTTSTVLVVKEDGLERLLVVTPDVVSAASNVFTPDGANFGLVTTFFDPLPCTDGYEGTRYRNGLDTSYAPLNTQARCVR